MEKKNKKYNIHINKNKVNTYNFILGDCIEKLKELDDKSIDIVVTSPPYNIGIK